MEKLKNFTELIAYQKSHVLVLEIYKITKSFPKEELFGMTNQMRRAAVSITSNIAEGFGRNSMRDKQHFYGIAKGSALELQSQTMVARDLQFLNSENYSELENKLVEVTKLIAELSKSAFSRIE